ncbi:hypothetical protein BRADI_2g43840v3 [Brachypodium distachyon]|uniref:Uncharacterized protein n=2 Tax=Brachypodium distachyon TaxID=15368 RepID=A0A0Q3J8J9_BRADI|nr:hypothetical protein BRADI_2g43840v3 [Brachypodium distachyon]
MLKHSHFILSSSSIASCPYPTRKMPRREINRKGSDGNAVWDMGSSLYDSYELASVQRILDRHLAGPPSPNADESRKGSIDTGAPPMVTEGRNKQAVVVFGARRKVTLRALFRGVASWAVRPRQQRGCSCVGVAPA